MTRALAFPGARPSGSADATAIAVRGILWACDFTSCSTRALQLVIPIARAYGSVITALHVLTATVPPSDGHTALFESTAHRVVRDAPCAVLAGPRTSP